jgi:CO/xanthine dehydrogenase Mo-binding subunit
MERHISVIVASSCGRERAAAALADLDSTEAHGRVVDINRRTIRAGLTALEGRTGDAQSAFREALAGWRDLGSPWREALTGITTATLLEPTDPEVRAAAEAAREILVRLEAKPFLDRLDEVLAHPSDRTGQPPPCSPARRPRRLGEDTLTTPDSLARPRSRHNAHELRTSQAECRGFESRLPLQHLGSDPRKTP